MTVHIANTHAFWGDDRGAPAKMLARADSLDYMTMDYLAEVTMAVLASQQAEDEDRGFATDFPDVVGGIIEDAIDRDVTILANAGGVNPESCRDATAAAIRDASVEATVATVSGDDFRHRIDEIDPDNLTHAYSGEPLPEGTDVLSANAYFGAFPVAEAIGDGADVVITGRVIDAALTMGPLIHEYGWGRDDHDRLARGMMAGHVIECGTQATGGNFYGDWEDIDFANIGFPIAAVEPDGTAEFTKPDGTGGKVTTGTIAEQVLYEVADPAKYYGPDVIADFQYAELEQVGNDRVGLTGIEGKPPTDRYKASLHYHDGWQVRGSLVYSQPNAVAKCEKAIESIREKADAAGVDYRRFYSERFGANALHASAASGDVEEVAARVNIVTDSKGDGYKFGSLLPPMGMAGPPGTTMFSPGRPSPSPNYAYHPVLVPKDVFDPNVEVMEV